MGLTCKVTNPTYCNVAILPMVTKDLLIHPCQREGLRVSEKMVRTYCINSITLGETQWDVSTSQGTRQDQKGSD